MQFKKIKRNINFSKNQNIGSVQRYVNKSIDKNADVKKDKKVRSI